MKQTSQPLRRGDQIARGYEVVEHLRRGRALDVYDVWSEERGCRCIVKSVRPDRTEDGPRRRVAEEGRLLCSFTHPHIVRAYELLESGPSIVMEMLPGETLSYMIEERRVALLQEEVAHLGLQLGSALRYLHAQGFLHLDLKPSNIIAESGRAKLIDLSVARRPGPARSGVGTWLYMAPEQAVGGTLGPEADVWGLGAVLFEAATGKPAFDAPDPEAVESGSWSASIEASSDSLDERELDDSDYPQLTTRAKRIDDLRRAPVALADLVAACLELDARRRPTVERVLAALEPLAGLPERERRFGRVCATE